MLRYRKLNFDDEIPRREVGVQLFIQIRQDCGYSQEVMAEKTNYTLLYYQQLEEGLRPITHHDIARALRVAEGYYVANLPFFQRLWTKFDFDMTDKLFILQSHLEWYFPSSTPVFDEISLRDILSGAVKLICGIIVFFAAHHMLPNSVGYYIGYGLGYTYKTIYQMIN